MPSCTPFYPPPCPVPVHPVDVPKPVMTVNNQRPDEHGNVNVQGGGEGDVKHSDFADMQPGGKMSLDEVNSKVDTLIRKLKGTAALAFALLSLQSFAALGPTTRFGAVHPDTTLREVVVAGGVPTKVSDLENDSGFVDKTVTNGLASVSMLPAKVSDLENDAEYVTKSVTNGLASVEMLPTKVSDLENDAEFVTKAVTNGLASIDIVPVKVSDLTNDAGYVTSAIIDGLATTGEVNAVASAATGITNGLHVVAGLNASVTAPADKAVVAIGSGALVEHDAGVAVGPNAKVLGANTYNGVAIGRNAVTYGGIAIGFGAANTGADGVAVGRNASTSADGAVQLGTGANADANTLKYRDTTVVGADGKIPTNILAEVFRAYDDLTYGPDDSLVLRDEVTEWLVTKLDRDDVIPPNSATNSGMAADALAVKYGLEDRVHKTNDVIDPDDANESEYGKAADAYKVKEKFVEWTKDDNGGKYTALTVGTRAGPGEVPVGTSSIVIGNGGIAPGNRSLSLGSAEAVGDDSIAQGEHSVANGKYAIALGNGAKADGKYSFVWQGGSAEGYYESKGDNTFNINPKEGLSGFWVGETNLADHITNLAPRYVPSAADTAFSNAVNAAVADYANVSNAAVTARNILDNVCATNSFTAWTGVPDGYTLVLFDAGWGLVPDGETEPVGDKKGNAVSTQLTWHEEEWPEGYAFTVKRSYTAKSGEDFLTETGARAVVIDVLKSSIKIVQKADGYHLVIEE